MALQLRARKRNINNWVLTAASAFAFVIAPFYGVIADRAAHALSNTTVSASDMQGWIVSNQDPSTVTGSFVTGPTGTGSLGTGSYQISSPQGKKLIAYNPSTYGKKLTDFSQLSYSTYVTNRDAGTKVAPAIDINAIINGQWTTLVYEPTYTNDNTATDQWQSWNALNGKWWSTKDLKNNSGVTVVQAFSSYVPWSTITGLDANATVSSDGAVGGVQIVIGQNSGGSPWSDFVGAFDDVNINGTVYDFEPAAPVPPAAPTSLYYTRAGSANTLACGSMTNAKAGMTLHWTAPAGNLKQYAIVPTYPNDHGEYTYYPTGSATSAWIGDNFGNHGDGIYSYAIKAQNSDGLWGSVATCDLVYDTTAPTISTITANGKPVALDGSTKVNTENGVNFKVTATDPSGWGYMYIELNTAAPSYTWKAANTQGSTTSLDTNANLYVDGKTYGLKICPTDVLGNGTCKQVNFTVDNTNPTMDLRYGENGAIIPSGAVISSTGKNIRIDKEKTATIHATVPGGATWTGGAYSDSYTGGKPSLDWLFPKYGDGTYTFYVEDTAGNVSSDYTVVIDNHAPSDIQATYTGGFEGVTTPVAVNGQELGGNLQFQVSENEAHPANMYIEINWLNPVTNKWEKHAGWGAATMATNGTFSLSDTAPSGKYQIKVSSIRDQAGNTALTKTFAFTVNNTVVTTINTIPTNTATPEITGTLTRGVDGSPAANTNMLVAVDGTTYTATTDAQGNWRVEPTVADGTHTVTVTLASTPLVPVSGGATAFTTTIPVIPPAGGKGGENTTTSQSTAANNTPNNGAGTRNAALLAILGTTNGQAVGTTTTPADQAVLGAQDPKSTDTSSNGDQAVKGASDTNKSNNGNIFGLAWYWWLVILAAIIALWWLIAAALRRRQAEA